MEWQPIETAPRDGTKVLIWNGEPLVAYFEVAKEWKESESGFNQWTTGVDMAGQYDCGFARISQPTHWAPIEPPTS